MPVARTNVCRRKRVFKGWCGLEGGGVPPQIHFHLPITGRKHSLSCCAFVINDLGTFFTLPDFRFCEAPHYGL